MITHVIVKLDAPIEEKYWQDDDIFSNEYYGLGKPLIRCKDCKHRPTVNGEYEDGYDIEFPTFMRCPCECEDGWYNWMPKDDWYCANAERKEECTK